MADRGEAPSDFVPDDAAGDDTARGRGGMPGGPFRRGGPLSEREREDIEFLKNYKVAIGVTRRDGRVSEGGRGVGRSAVADFGQACAHARGTADAGGRQADARVQRARHFGQYALLPAAPP